jgi:hypothetical protein
MTPGAWWTGGGVSRIVHPVGESVPGFSRSRRMSKSEMFAGAAEAHQRDPRAYPYGYLTGGSDEMKSVRVFVWFRTIDELIDSLLEVEPRMYGVEPRRGLEGYQQRVRPILDRLKQQGFDESLRAEFAPETDGKFVVDWWGSYSELREGRGSLGGQLVEEFLGSERRKQLLPSGEDTAFIDFLRPPAG